MKKSLLLKILLGIIALLSLILLAILCIVIFDLQKLASTSDEQLSESPASSPISQTLTLEKLEIGREEQFEINKAALGNYLTQNKLTQNFAIYFTSLGNPNLTYELNSSVNYAPASIYKVPLAMNILKKIEQKEAALEQIVTYDGEDYTVAEALELLIRKSDNDAMTALERGLGGYPQIEEEIRTDLGVNIKRRGQESTAKEIATVFKQLTTADQYLADPQNELLLEHLLNVVSYQQDRIPVGVEQARSQMGTAATAAEDLQVAHKIGQLDGIYQDAALIYTPTDTYILVVLNRNQLTTTIAAQRIQNITKILLTNLL